jgi:hypothetical protein
VPAWTQSASDAVIAPAPQIERQAPVVDTAAPVVRPEAPAASSPQVEQGELLSRATAHPAAPSPAPLADDVPPSDAQPPKDAAQG